MMRQSMQGADFGKVAVLMGGDSAEREVSLMSGQGVLQALCASGVDAHAFDPALQDVLELGKQGFQRCFIALHGRHGEDGTVQGALELLGIPYTGSGVLASSVCMDKTMTKRIWIAEGLHTPRYVALRAGQQHVPHIAKNIQSLGLPLIVKPPHEGSSIGVGKLQDWADLDEVIAKGAQHEDDVLCEEFIEGEELTCALLGSGDDAVALPVIRIQAPGGAYDYQNKYFTDEVRYLCPSDLPQEEEDAIRALALASYKALGCRGWGRVDVMLRARDRKAFLLEMNTSPGMTSHSLVPMAARAAGVTYEALCLQVLAQASLDGAFACRNGKQKASEAGDARR